MQRPGSTALAVTLIVAGLLAAGLRFGGPPAPLPASAPATEFSAERAMAHVERIAQRPHPVGSADHARVRDDVARTLEGLGLAVERQVATVVRGGGAVRGGAIENLMARLKGTAGEAGAILLATHYDSVPAAPGAADAGSGVGALLETLRALKAGGALRHDVIALFTDGEENGLLGAAAFVDQHRWAKDVRLVLNFEARGTSGPAQMFETSPGNALLVAEWAANVPHPSGSSLAGEVYKRMPNGTDFSEFLRLGVGGLNFAFVGFWEAYHTPLDSAANLDRGSLQHHGSAALALTRRFDTLDLGGLKSGDAVYFSLPIVQRVVRYSTAWAVPLAGVAAVLFVWIVIRARRRGDTSIGGLILAFILCTAFAGLAGLWGYRFGRVIALLHGRSLPPGNTVMSAPYAVTEVAAVVTVWLALYVLLRKTFAAQTLALGSMAGWVVLAAVSAWMLPGGSYVLAWPILGGLLSAALLAGRDPSRSTGFGRGLVMCAFGVPAIVILWPLAAMLFTSLGLTPEGGAAIAVVSAFALTAMAPLAELAAEGRRWWPAGVALILTLLGAGIGAATTAYSAEHPRPVNVLYVLDADSSQADWAVRVDRVDPWLKPYLGDAPRVGRPAALVPPWSNPQGIAGFLHQRAAVVELPAPGAVVLAKSGGAGGRVLTMKVTPAAAGHTVTVWIAGATVLEARINGRAIRADASAGPASDSWSLDYVNAPADGVTIALDVKGLQPLNVTVLDRANGLPEIPGFGPAPHPKTTMPIQGGDQTIVRRRFTF